MKNTSTSLLVLVSIVLSACGGIAMEGPDEQFSPSVVPTVEPTATSSSSGVVLPPPVVVPFQDAGTCEPCASHQGCQGVDCPWNDAAPPECEPCATHPGCQGVDCDWADAATPECIPCGSHPGCQGVDCEFTQ